MIDETEGSHVVGGPTEVLQIPGREWRDFRLQRRQPPPTTRVVWIRCTEASCRRLLGLQAETSPRTSHEPHTQTSKLPGPPTSGGLTRQPSAVEKPAYTTPTGILQRPPDDSEDEMSSTDDWSNDNDESVAAMGDANLEETHNDNYQFETTSAKISGEHTNRAEPEDIGSDNSQTTGVECKVSTMSPLQVLEKTFILVIRVLTTEGNEASNTICSNVVLSAHSLAKCMRCTSFVWSKCRSIGAAATWCCSVLKLRRATVRSPLVVKSSSLS
ncbi:unnamed protein product [Phytophthora lilii]|uniref:Unnamed protein product n=1 Tax=Phytophthora lilii TaxID=2077276 RepID=A0A9W6X9S4_9STRA|nr:unnamed protein product [Phytophthora lilii]